MPEKHRVYVVPHTHWDREWYGSFQLFRLRLVRLMNKLLALMERDPDYACFNLDGQTIILEDYLEIHPEQEATLRQLVGEKRLMVGPWYILPDEFLTSGESLVRNLLLGAEMAQDFGHRMEVGYIPDTFGHIAQLPQILRGFGLDNCMNFRGLDFGGRQSELWWQAPDGSRVLLHHMSTIIGYSDLGAMATDPQRAAYDLRALAYYKAERATGPVLLAMQGVDHAEAREDLPQIIALANASFDDLEFIQASPEDFWDALKESLDGQDLETVYGELRDVPRSEGSMNFLLYNVLSSRVDNKLKNAQTLTALEQWAEPWCALAWLWDLADYPRGHLWTAWKWLLKNHHDSIGGCSVDAVHRQMMTRFEWAQEIADYLAEERFRLLAQQVDLSAAQDDEIALLLFNATPRDREEIVTVDVDLPEYWLRQQALAAQQPAIALNPDSPYDDVKAVNTQADWAYGSPALPEVFFRGLRLRTLDGTTLPVRIHSIEQTTQAIALASGPRGVVDVRRVRISFPAQIPAHGYASYLVRTESKPQHWPARHNPAANRLENDALAIDVHPNGSFDLYDKTSQHTYPGLGLFEDSGDNGDGYTFSPPPFNRVYTTQGASPRISKVGTGVNVQQIRIEFDLALPVGLDDARQRRRDETAVCRLCVDLILRDGSPRLELHISLDNRVKDHRLRLRFPTGFGPVATASSAMQFDVMTRPTRPSPIAPGDWWVESPPETFPMHGWMDVAAEDGHAGLSVATAGLHEFAVEDGTVALTLLRAVGYLGAGRDITTLIGGAGPRIPTPEAQLQQELYYQIALCPHVGNWESAQVWRQAQDFLTPPRSITEVPHGGARLPVQRGIQVSGDNAMCSSIKQSEDGLGLILRLYNPTAKSTQAQIILPKPTSEVSLTDLQEQTLAAVALSDRYSFSVELAPKQIITLKAILAPNA